jgi:hypothetical protein
VRHPMTASDPRIKATAAGPQLALRKILINEIPL